MRRLAAAFVLLAVSAPAALGQAPYSGRWGAAVAVVAAGIAFVIPEATKLPKAAPSCAPCDAASLPGVDRVALHTFSGSAGTASTALLVGVIGFAGIASLDGATPAQRRGHVAAFANSLAWTLAASDWMKVVVRRKRPALYTAGATAAAADPNSQRSFPSGHASVAFATATTYLMMARRERLPHRGRNAALLYVGAVGVSALRVAAGKHFTTDVLGGGGLGPGVGRAAAKGHPAPPRPGRLNSPAALGWAAGG